MEISKNLYLVMPLEREDGTKLYIHHSPVRMAVFETYYNIFARAFTQIYMGGLMSGPRISALTIKSIAEAEGTWKTKPGDATIGVEQGLMGEIKRLTNVVMPTPEKGWQTIPFEDAVRRNLLDDEEQSEVLNATSFFTVGYRMYRKDQRKAILTGAAMFWDAQISSLDCSAFVVSLGKLTETETSSEKQQEEMIQPSLLPF